MPFLKKHVQLHASQKKVENLYLQLFSIEDTSLAFLGLPFSVVPFPLYYFQTLAVASVLLFRHLHLENILPSRDEQVRWLSKYTEMHPNVEKFHYLGDEQFDYNRQLLRLAKPFLERYHPSGDAFLERLEKYLKFLQEVYQDCTSQRPPYPGAPDEYRNREYDVNSVDLTWNVV